MNSSISFVGGVIFWIAVVVIVVAQIAIVRSVALAGRAGDPARRAGELAWAALPALALAATMFFTWRALR